MADCIFCQIVGGAIPTHKLYEDHHILAFEDVNPQAPVHVLVIPKRHIVSLNEIQSTDVALIGEMLAVCGKMGVERGVAHSGYRVVANTGREAGQSVLHLHFHVLGGRAFEWPPG